MWDHFAAFGIKVLKCQVYTKAVAYLITEETRVWNEKKEIMKYEILHKWKTCSVLENAVTNFGSV